MNSAVINFGAGPSKIPKMVLEEVQRELLNYNSTGMSVLEISHRSSEYAEIHNKVINLTRELLNVPDNYKVLFLHGGGRALFSAVAMNLISKTGKADYLITGTWSSIAAKDGSKYGDINEISINLETCNPSEIVYSKNTSYVYYCDNETIEGKEFSFVPETNGIPLVCDMASNIFTRKIDVSKFGLIFAGAQKNIGTSALAVVIVDEKLIGTAIAQCPPIFDFSILAEMNSILNTPPIFAIYVCGKALNYVKTCGGIEEMEKLCEIKSRTLYYAIDNSNGFYVSNVRPNIRSRINVTFRISGGETIENEFLKFTSDNGIVGIKGHKYAGGIRVSLYNSITVENVKYLIQVMQTFAAKHGAERSLSFKMSSSRRIANFGAGPAKLPREVLKEVQDELLDFNGTGISMMETSHRSPVYENVHNEATAAVRELLNVPNNYKILFMHGGGKGLFAAVPLNLMWMTGKADYVVTGSWSAAAAKEAEKYGVINQVLPKLEKGSPIPDVESWNLSEDASYVYYCDNETIEGIEFTSFPSTKGIPVVCDMSSNIFTKEIDVSKYGIIFACAQKNIGPAGVTLVIVNEDLLLAEANRECPSILNFAAVAKSNSLLNTPPTFIIYVCGKYLKYYVQNGGIKKQSELCKLKSELIYKAIEQSNGFYVNEVHPQSRSRISVTFRIQKGPEFDAKFVKFAESRGIIQVKGHRSVGGMRASLYNAVTLEDVEQLLETMRIFSEENS